MIEHFDLIGVDGSPIHYHRYLFKGYAPHYGLRRLADMELALEHCTEGYHVTVWDVDEGIQRGKCLEERVLHDPDQQRALKLALAAATELHSGYHTDNDRVIMPDGL